MSQHTLIGTTESEVLWFQRRSFLSAAAAFTAMGGYAGAQAQARSNVVELIGDALLNGRKMLPQTPIQTGDTVETGPGSSLIFVLGEASFQVRQNTRLNVERGTSLTAVSVLRMITGGVASVWGKGRPRRIMTPTLTAGIRGTGVYTEIMKTQDQRSYFCNCYGVVDLTVGNETVVSDAVYHQAFWGETIAQKDRLLTPAKPLNHSDEELEFLARLINQRTAWQIMGKKGVKDGTGYMDATPGKPHPASMPR